MVNKLFLTLATRYGAQWTNQWRDDRMLQFAKDEWCKQLSGFTAEDIKHGLEEYRGQFAPNIMQFVDACASREALPAPCYKEYESDKKALEHLKTDKATGAEFLKKIREGKFDE